MISGTTKALLTKYRKILIAVGLFLMFDLGVMGTNLYSSYLFSESAVSINLSGRQRMLSQRTTKALLLLQEDMRQGLPQDKDLEELKQVVHLFDTTLLGFRDGAMVTGGDMKPVFLTKVETEKSEQYVKEAYDIWIPYLAKLQPLISGSAYSETDLAAAADYARKNNLTLLRLMNDLTTDLEHMANARALRLRIIQIVGLLAALFNFGYTVFISVRDLIASDQEVAKARQETDEILSTVREGLFLIDAEYRLGSQYSDSLEQVLQHEIQPGLDFMSVLKTMVPKPIYEASRDYIDLLFGDRVKEALVTDLNPLDRVAIRSTGTGSEKTRYLSFHFNRVTTGKTIPYLLVTVQDITELVHLGIQLEEAKGRARAEVEVLIKLLNTDPEILLRFLNNVEGTLNQINERLRANESTQQDRLHTVNFILRSVHGLKGEAATLNIEMFESYAHECEKEIVGIRDRDEVTGEDMVRITVLLEGFYERLSSLSGIIKRMKSLGGPSEDEENQVRAFTEGLQTLAQRIASDQNKEVDLTLDVQPLRNLPKRVIRELQAISIQLTRNAISHGIEEGAARVEAHKAPMGHLLIQCQNLGNDQYEFIVRDDGNGIIPQRIRQVLVESGRMTPEEAERLDDVQVAQQIFEPGFSSAKQADRDAGHGVGLDVVLEKVRAIHGRLQISSRAHKFTEFRIHFEL